MLIHLLTYYVLSGDSYPQVSLILNQNEKEFIWSSARQIRTKELQTLFYEVVELFPKMCRNNPFYEANRVIGI